MFLGSSGAGKSTLVRTIIIDYLVSNPSKHLFIWLSEESTEDLKNEIMVYAKMFGENSRLHCFSEQDKPDCVIEDALDALDEAVFTYDCDMFLFDNITTSKFYGDKTPTEQSDFATNLKIITKKYNLATIAIAHTNKQFTYGRLIDDNDIRGSSHITNITEFLYIMQMFTVGSKSFQTLHIKKHRPCDVNNKFFTFSYSKDTRTYETDTAQRFEHIKSIFKQANRL